MEPVQPDSASQRQEAEQPEHALDEILQKEKRARQRRGWGGAVIEFLTDLFASAVGG